jgi:hypothetical protein
MRLCGPRDRYGRLRNVSLASGFEPRTVQRVASAPSRQHLKPPGLIRVACVCIAKASRLILFKDVMAGCSQNRRDMKALMGVMRVLNVAVNRA